MDYWIHLAANRLAVLGQKNINQNSMQTSIQSPIHSKPQKVPANWRLCFDLKCFASKMEAII